MSEILQVADIPIEVLRKPIRNMHLSVYPPTGAVRISAPTALDLEAVRLFAVTKLGWIRSHQLSQRLQPREPEREYLDRESHYLWGRRYLLKVIESEVPTHVALEHSRLVLFVRPGASVEDRAGVMAAWHRQQLRSRAEPLIAQWESVLGVQCHGLFIRQMKTRWGSCNASRGTIRLNTDLAKRPPQCLEYIVVHELAHIADPSHGRVFQHLLDSHLPNWAGLRELLNDSSLSHAQWVTLDTQRSSVALVDGNLFVGKNQQGQLVRP